MILNDINIRGDYINSHLYKQNLSLIMQMAEDARKKCEDENVIDRDKRILSLKDLKNILMFYGCDLKRDNNSGYSISKVDNESYDFIITYALNKLDETSLTVDKFKLLTILGELFMGYETFANETKKDIKYDITYMSTRLLPMSPETFARAFMLPKQLFITEAVSNMCNDLVDTKDLSKIFKIDTRNILLRGKELELWK